LNRIQNKNFLRGFPPDGRYLIGVSGGRDSIALLHWLRECGYRKLIVCHLIISFVADRATRMRGSSKNWPPIMMSILKWDPRTCERSRQNKKSRSKRPRGMLAINFLHKWQNKGVRELFLSAITPTIWSKLS